MANMSTCSVIADEWFPSSGLHYTFNSACNIEKLGGPGVRLCVGVGGCECMCVVYRMCISRIYTIRLTLHNYMSK